jgi:hypothetical protein
MLCFEHAALPSCGMHAAMLRRQRDCLLPLSPERRYTPGTKNWANSVLIELPHMKLRMIVVCCVFLGSEDARGVGLYVRSTPRA